jgi:hypothetical protein
VKPVPGKDPTGRIRTAQPKNSISAGGADTLRTVLASLDLDGTWQFVPDPAGSYSVGTLPSGARITVPGSWEAQLPERYGIVQGWYRRSLSLPSAWQGMQLVLRFGAVMYRAEVWLDRRFVGAHEGGFTPFELDLSGTARPGSEQELTVRVTNPLNALSDYPPLPMEEVLYAKDRMGRLPLSEAPHGKQTWYGSLSGIWQSVRVEAMPATSFAQLGVSTDPQEQAAQISWKLQGPSKDASLVFRVLDGDGRQLAKKSRRLSAAADCDSGSERIVVPEARAWSPETPALYVLEAQMRSSSGSIHQRSVRFGFRRIEARGGRILLNGKPILLRGALDQDLYPEGLSLSGDREAFYRAQFAQARAMGLNLIRCHIKVPDPAYLDAADETGILLWCELPNWTQFSSRSAQAARETLRDMVAQMENHPSVVIWTIINEDWGTRLRDEVRDRRWLLSTYEWLKQLDPSRLVVDNSACDSPNGKPNFHLATDIADFHAYFSMPDKAIRWRGLVDDFAGRPPWLWSPHGDARPRGDEPLVLSEFGNWGLPDISRIDSKNGDAPWWFATGRQLYQPAGALERFRHFGLERIWPDWAEMARATQERQFEALQFEIGELRRHSSVAGYVITEFTDAFWEANGLLGIDRAPKAFHSRLAEINGEESLIADLARRDCWGGDCVGVAVTASSWADRGAGPTSLEWTLLVNGAPRTSGTAPIQDWPRHRAAPIAQLAVPIPEVQHAERAELLIRARTKSNAIRAEGRWSLAIIPGRRRVTATPRRVAVDDPLRIWGLEDRLRELGHHLVASNEAEVLITTELSMGDREFASGGGNVLVLVRSRSALPAEVELQREVVIHPRWLADDSATDPRNPWRGDWISAFSWLEPGRFPDVPEINPLDFAFQEVIPDHVLRGYHPQRHADEVSAGMFVGWVHAPAALLWSFREGEGQMTITTFKLAPEQGPVATVLLDDLIQGAGVAAAPSSRELMLQS